MKPVFIDLHIHTSENPDKWNKTYNLDLLKEKIEEAAEGSDYLISLTDHNTINKPVYLKAVDKFNHILLGAELHVRNYKDESPYHCHIYFNLKQIDVSSIDSINAILDKLYPNKVVADNDTNIPRLEDIMNSFDSFEFVLLPHGGQSHKTFDKSIPEGTQFDNTMERNIYYNHFDGFTARSDKGLERTNKYFGRLEINEFVNLITASDNYSPQNYPNGKDKTPFVKTWMLASPTFNGLRLSLSESSRLEYGAKPDLYAEHIKHVSLKNDHIDIDVNLTPGLNVVIGGSSSGKSLFVDSLYHKIINKINQSVYVDTPYGIQDIQVINPSAQSPHYLYQNYIMNVCDHKDKENTIDDIPILKSVFPPNTEELQEIENGLSELSSQLASLVQSVEQIELLQSALTKIPILSHLIVPEVIQDNPLKYILPTEKIRESIRYSKASYTDDVKNLDRIDKFLSRNPLVEHDSTLIEKLKKELDLAFERSGIESNFHKIIIFHKKEIDNAQESVNKERTFKKLDFEKLLDNIKQYFKFNKQFYRSLKAISEFSIKSHTDEIESMGHKLFISNSFELTKETFLGVVNSMMTSKTEIKRFEDITPEALFKARFRQAGPKVKGYEDFKNKVNAKFVNMNKKKYQIITKNGKDFDKLSAGWKTSVVLDLILGSTVDNAPLIIDQPEDNLATSYINTGLLKAIKKCKSKKQIILVSHNATIPMLGDAQNIVMCRNDDKNITIRSNPLEGSINGVDVVDLVAKTTDGGKISIKKRVKKYNLKKFRSSDEVNI